MRRWRMIAETNSLSLSIFPGVSAMNEAQQNWRQMLPDGVDFATDYVKLSDTEWQARLEANRYRVLRREGTEPPGSSTLNDEKRPGVFVCAGCGAPLFTSAMKFDSGTGWAQLLHSGARRAGNQTRLQADHAAHRISLRALRRPSRSSVQRRSGADGFALLQQRSRTAFSAEGPAGIVRKLNRATRCNALRSVRPASRPPRPLHACRCAPCLSV